MSNPVLRPRIALFGGSFNPPGLHHVAIATVLAERFDQVIVVPCGPRPDKPSAQEAAPMHRGEMAKIAFAGIGGCQVDLFDVASATFTRTYLLEKRYSSLGEIWHVVGADLVRGGAENLSEIQRSWVRGKELWLNSRFVVITRPGHIIKTSDLPPISIVIEQSFKGSSSEIRAALAGGNQEELKVMLQAEVLSYIRKNKLYG